MQRVQYIVDLLDSNKWLHNLDHMHGEQMNEDIYIGSIQSGLKQNRIRRRFQAMQRARVKLQAQLVASALAAVHGNADVVHSLLLENMDVICAALDPEHYHHGE
jgi:hypothetical protein